MTIQELASKVANAEGKKHQATIGDVREILSILVEMSANAQTQSECPATFLLTQAALKRSKSSKNSSPDKES